MSIFGVAGAPELQITMKEKIVEEPQFFENSQTAYRNSLTFSDIWKVVKYL